MTAKELEILEALAIEEFENTHDSFAVLTEDEQDLFIAGFLDSLAWAIRSGHISIGSLALRPEDFVDPEETPEEREAYLKSRYDGLSPEGRKLLEEIDKEDAKLWKEYVNETIARNKALHNFGVRVLAGST